MEILKSSIHKVDHITNDCQNIPSNSSSDDLNNYVVDLLETIGRSRNKRSFTFESDTTEVYSQIISIIDSVNNGNGQVESRFESIAKRLLRTEMDTQDSIAHLVELQRGVFLQALIKDENQELKVVLAKADQSQYLDEENLENREGLPLKKKIYKAFLGNLSSNNEISDISVYDSQSIISKYWWKDFLELSEVFTDEQNTKTAFKALEIGVFNPMKKKHKADYFNLRNATVKYFQTDTDFSLEYYLDEVIGDYDPIDPELDLDNFKEKVRSLPSGRNKFDERFRIKPKEIKARQLKLTVKLTNEIDLNINKSIPDQYNVIQAFENEHGEKFVAIKSEPGYAYFKRRNNNEG